MSQRAAAKTLEQVFHENAQREVTAYHESGHAVLAHLMNVPRGRVTVRKRGLAYGRQLLYPRGVKLHSLACVLLGGMVAQQILLDEETEVGCEVDVAAFKALKFVLPINLVKSEVRVMMENPVVWDMVERVALALLDKSTLTATQVAREIRKARS